MKDENFKCFKTQVKEAILKKGETYTSLGDLFKEQLNQAGGEIDKLIGLVRGGPQGIIESLKELAPEERQAEAKEALRALEEFVPGLLDSINKSIERTRLDQNSASQPAQELIGELGKHLGEITQTFHNFKTQMHELLGDGSSILKEGLEGLIQDNLPRAQKLFGALLTLSTGVASDTGTGLAGLFNLAKAQSSSSTSKEE